MSFVAPPSFARAPLQWTARRVALTLLVTAIADYLIFIRHPGLSIALFLGGLGAVAALVNPRRAGARTLAIASALFVLSLMPLVEDLDFLSFMFAIGGLALYVIVIATPEGATWPRVARRAILLPFSGPFALIADFLRLNRMARRGKLHPGLSFSVTAWIVPLGLLAVFAWLFAAANPLIDGLLAKIDLSALMRHIDMERVVFWCFIAVAIWPLMRVRGRRALAKGARPARLAATAAAPGELLGKDAILRSLVLFNALFAMQTALDAAYLWGGVALPDGMTYASYAHRGAYPLIVTALLAAGFVLVATRKGGPARESRAIRVLVVAFTLQNIALVASSILRLDLYVSVYSLTYLRLAAFVWMGLVAVGLALILIQMALDKPVTWLLGMNFIAAVVALYACCFINAPRLIADWNVAHREAAGRAGVALDVNYLSQLGPQALPAVDMLLRSGGADEQWLIRLRAGLLRIHRTGGDWRAWSFRAWRLNRYLDNNPMSVPVREAPAEPQAR